MDLFELEKFLKSYFDFSVPDSAINGVQVAHTPREIKKIATAVDTSLATVSKAIEMNADVLLVHHGIFWGTVEPVVNRHYRLLKEVLKHDLAIVGIHLPLDLHQEIGNNILILQRLGFEFDGVFGNYKGLSILFKGHYPNPNALNWEAFLDQFKEKIGQPLKVISAERPVKKIAVCSGGGLFGIEDALREGCDTYITGDINHTVHRQVVEEKINLIAGGHYNTEIWGIKKLGELLQDRFGFSHQFIDLPTGL